MTILVRALPMVSLLPWAALWSLGGIWLARAAFRLRGDGELLVGIAVGWIAQNWLANLLAQVISVPLAFWAASAVIFLSGALAVSVYRGRRALLEWKVPFSLALLLAFLIYLSFGMGRGLAIFDDFQHLPTASVMAAGDIPPHFVLDPDIVFGYHHFLLLFSAQLIRIGSLMPWVAVDAARAISFGLAVLLAGMFARRITRSLVGGILGGVVAAFASGTRWLLLILPMPLLDCLGAGVHLIGSGVESGATLPEALGNAWGVQGSGAVPFPFAFANGIYPPGVIQLHNANGLAGLTIILLLLLTFDRWRNNGLGAVLSAVLISVWGLLGEAELPAIAAGWGIVAIACIITGRARPWYHRLPRALWAWLGIAAAGALIGLLEGGAWTDILLRTLSRWSGAAAASYQTIEFQLAWPPAVISSHLGALSLLDPRALLVALLELGPLLLVFPLLVAWGIKAFRIGRWYDAATVASAVVMLLALFVQFSGSTGVRNTPRLYFFMPLLAVFAVPLAWIWAAHRSYATKMIAVLLGLLAVTGGLVMFAIELAAFQRPVYADFLTPLDARLTREYWNRLEEGALVFDPEPSRAPTVLGRPTDSNLTWYQVKPEWKAMLASPDPHRLRAAGFSYIYLDNGYWNGLAPQIQQAYTSSCVKAVAQAEDNLGNFRKLLDIRGCQ
jgi:hypothetical protein